MANPDHNVLRQIVEMLRDGIAELEAIRSSEDAEALLLRWGWVARISDVTKFRQSIAALNLDALADPDFNSIANARATLDAIAAVVQSVGDLPASLVDVAPDNATGQALATDAIDGLVRAWLRKHGNATYEALDLLGLVSHDARQELRFPASGDPLLWLPSIPAERLNITALSSLIGSPAEWISQRLAVMGAANQQEAEAVTRTVLGALSYVAEALGCDVWVGLNTRPDTFPQSAQPAVLQIARSAGFAASFDQEGGGRTTLTLVVEVLPDGGVKLHPRGDWTFTSALARGVFTSSASAVPEEILLRPQGSVSLPQVSGTSGILFDASYRFSDEKTPLILGSTAAGLHLTGFGADLEVAMHDTVALSIKCTAEHARFVVGPPDEGGFLALVLPAEGISADFKAGLGWSSSRGLHLEGAASLEADLPVQFDIAGVLRVNSVRVWIHADGTQILAGAAADIQAHIGPVSAVITGMGVSARIEPKPTGNLGPANIDLEFRPPTGIGLGIETAVAKGSGFLAHPGPGRYAGALQLKLVDKLGVSAFGLLVTPLPGRTDGFSLLVLIAAEFPPIQLGYGFTLTGIGGLLGLNRSMDPDALSAAARQGRLGSILFPENVEARVPEILQTLDSVFPVAPGRFAVGLMAKLGWGTPVLVKAELGLLLELPPPLRIALLGRLRARLPSEAAAAVALNVEMAGLIDFGRRELAVDASLYDSRFGPYTAAAEAALRFGWGAGGHFELSLGGFNPRFPAPQGFPALQRAQIAVASGDNPRLRLEAYLAVTTNSVQAGAWVEAHAAIRAIWRWSADAQLGFDALIGLQPFSFIVDVSGGVVIRRDGKAFLEADAHLTVSGPDPLHAIGHIEFDFLGKRRIQFDVTAGQGIAAAAIEPQDPSALLLEAAKDPSSWSALPPDTAMWVKTVRSGGKGLVAHPAGKCSFRQNVVPLGVGIDRFGGLPLGRRTTFAPQYLLGAAPPAAIQDLRTGWSPGHYFNLSDDEKVSRPGFMDLPAGHQLDPKTPPEPATHSLQVEYVSGVLDPDPESGQDTAPPANEPVLKPFRHASIPVADNAVRIRPLEYVLAERGSLAAEQERHASWVEAAQEAELRPGDAPQLRVLQAHEAVQ